MRARARWRSMRRLASPYSVCKSWFIPRGGDSEADTRRVDRHTPPGRHSAPCLTAKVGYALGGKSQDPRRDRNREAAVAYDVEKQGVPARVPLTQKIHFYSRSHASPL